LHWLLDKNDIGTERPRPVDKRVWQVSRSRFAP
jgi:hypothetical protein